MTTIQKFGTPGNLIHMDEKVIALVDEGHRTQYKFNAAAMRYAMPNAVFFAFTGNPIDKKDRSTYIYLIVDYCGITRELQNALAIFREDIKGALDPAEVRFATKTLRGNVTLQRYRQE